MHWTGLGIAIIWALFLIWLFALAFDTRGPWGSLLWFFIIVFLFSWTGAMWSPVIGPVWGGVAWLPILFIGLIVALLLAAATPPGNSRRNRARSAAPGETPPTDSEDLVIGGFFWVLLVLLVIAIVSAWWRPVV